MLRVFLKVKYDFGIYLVVIIFSMGFGDLIFKGLCNDVIFLNGLSLIGVVFGVEKLNIFVFDYDCIFNVFNNLNFKFFEIRDV